MKTIKLFFFNYLKGLFRFFARLGVNRSTPGALKIYNFLFKIFWPFGDIVEVQGSKMYVNLEKAPPAMRMALQGYATNRVHEKETTELFKRIVKPGNVVLDLGANIGYFTLLAAKLVGSKGKVYSFEPEPMNFYYLKKNAEINSYTQINPFQKAVSNEKGITKLFICPYDSGHHTMNQYEGISSYRPDFKNKGKRSVEIETVVMDDFFEGREQEIDVVKMDVEGAELLALSGMDNILKKNQKIKMIVEFFPLLINKMGSDPKELIKRFLYNYNFSISVIPDDYDAKIHNMIKINSVDEIMKFIEREADHVNLFLEKNK